MIRLLKSIRKPVLCAVNGIAAGAGANIALACDIVVATASASFVQAFSKIGLIPDCGGTFFLPRLVGLQKATALMMLGDKICAAEAEQYGMIYTCFEDGLFRKINKSNCGLTGQASDNGSDSYAEKPYCNPLPITWNNSWN